MKAAGPKSAEAAESLGALANMYSLWRKFDEAVTDWEKARARRAAMKNDEWLRVGGVKGFADGSLGSGTALFFEPYDDDPGNRGVAAAEADAARVRAGATTSSTYPREAATRTGRCSAAYASDSASAFSDCRLKKALTISARARRLRSSRRSSAKESRW